MSQKDQLLSDLRNSRVPEHDHEGLIDYVLLGYQPGHFLIAVLENDLKEACARADTENQRALFDIVSFLYNYTPMSCWGSPAKVSAWMKGHAEQRKGNASAALAEAEMRR